MDICSHISNIPGLSAEINEKLREIFAEFHEIQACILYGSRAKGTHRHASDVDITLVTHSMEIGRVLKLEGKIDDMLLPWMFDVSRMNTIENPALLDHIRRVGLCIYRRDNNTDI